MPGVKILDPASLADMPTLAAGIKSSEHRSPQVDAYRTEARR